MDMNTLNKKHIELLQENNIDKDLHKSNYKIYIKQLIINNLPDAKFIASP